MTNFTVLTPYLDECGSVYLPGLGDDGSAVRLNQRASAVWRTIVVTGGRVPEDLSEDDKAFLRLLTVKGLVRPVTNPGGV